MAVAVGECYWAAKKQQIMRMFNSEWPFNQRITESQQYLRAVQLFRDATLLLTASSCTAAAAAAAVAFIVACCGCHPERAE